MQLLLNILILICLYSLIGFSFKIIYSALSSFVLDIAIILSIAPYITYTLVQTYPNFIFAILVTLICCISLSIFFYFILYNPLKKLKLENWQILLSSLGVYIILQNLISIIWGDSTLSFRTWEVKTGHLILGTYITDVQIITFISCVILLFFSWLFIEKTKIGQQIKVVSSNPKLSSYYGISVNKATMCSFALGSGLAACAGILIAADTDMTPTMGFNWLLYGVVAMIIGGMGKIRYLVLGALLLATAQHLSAYYLDSKWMNATAYIILIIFLFFKPYGFSGQKLKKQEL